MVEARHNSQSAANPDKQVHGFARLEHAGFPKGFAGMFPHRIFSGAHNHCPAFVLFPESQGGSWSQVGFNQKTFGLYGSAQIQQVELAAEFDRLVLSDGGGHQSPLQLGLVAWAAQFFGNPGEGRYPSGVGQPGYQQNTGHGQCPGHGHSPYMGYGIVGVVQ